MDYQIEPVKEQVNTALKVVNDLTITAKPDYDKAVEIGTRIKQVAKVITERKEEITKPLNEALKSARNLFKPIEETLEKAESELKNKMLAFKDLEHKQAEEAQKEADRIKAEQQAKVKSGEISHMEAAGVSLMAQIDANMAQPEKTTKTDSGAKATEKFITTYEVKDKTLIPLEFMEPNIVAIKQSFKDGKPVPGVEMIKKPIIAF